MTDVFIPDIFEGRVIKRGDDDYEGQCYQYASSSYMVEDIVRPAAIIMAEGDEDVIKAINYARDNGIAVAVRTGGHQYSGASSTSGKNIQLDLSQTYKNVKWNNPDCTSVTFGVSFTLSEFNAKLREKNRFVPHGQCQYVNLGGHIQTGGYGQLARGFGLLSDNVESFRIITADGKVHEEVNKDGKDKDLFFAVLGGSPGNFGVLTHVTLRVFRDEDYPDSRGFRAVYPYDSTRLKNLLDVMVDDMVKIDDFPADYDYCITVMEIPEYVTYETTYDMKYNRKKNPQQALVTLPRTIIVFAQWANLKGKEETYCSKFIDKIQKVAEEKGKGLVIVSDKEHTPLSTLTGNWIIPISREFDLPYFKRTFSSNYTSEELEEVKWTDWVSNRIDEGYKNNLNLSAQFQHFGGCESTFYKNGINSPTSFSWRDTRLGCTMDAFYHSRLYNNAKTWVQINDFEGVGKSDAKFCNVDRRVLWGSHDLDLSSAWKNYYDTREKYDQLCEIKKTYDKSGVFTPNKFCIGLEEKDQPRIEPAVPETPKKEVPTEEESVEDKFWRMVETKGATLLWDHWRA